MERTVAAIDRDANRALTLRKALVIEPKAIEPFHSFRESIHAPVRSPVWIASSLRSLAMTPNAPYPASSTTTSAPSIA
jgi:hypothetical protein